MSTTRGLGKEVHPPELADGLQLKTNYEAESLIKKLFQSEPSAIV